MIPEHDPLLLSLLARSYGSSVRARVALDEALARAGLDRLPSSPGELASFLRIHLHGVVEADLGGFIADATTEELLSLVDDSEHQPPATSAAPRSLAQVSVRSTIRAIPKQQPSAAEVEPPVSQLRRRKAASVMLVRVDPAEEAQRFDPSEFADSVLRVVHPLPACERMRIMRPFVIIVGSAVFDRDVELLTKAAREIGCEVVELGAFVSHATFHEALHRAVARASSRRPATEHGELPSSERATLKPGGAAGPRSRSTT